MTVTAVHSEGVVGLLAGPRPGTPELKGVPILRAAGVSRRFGQVEALRGVDLEVGPGEVVGLVGDNGAGKSTLVRILSGGLRADAGRVELAGSPVALGGIGAARAAGIEVVYQDLALAPDLDPVANLFLGREWRRAGAGRLVGSLARREMREQAVEVFARTGLRLPRLDVPVRVLSGGQRQLIAVVRAVAFASRVLLMDEPTAALGVEQTERVAALVTEASAGGVGVVIVSHNLPELLQLVDRVVVLRLGQVAASFPADTVGTTELISAMTGLPA